MARKIQKRGGRSTWDGGLAEERFAAAVRREYRRRKKELGPLIDAAPASVRSRRRDFVDWVRVSVPDAFEKALNGTAGRPRRPRLVEPVQSLDRLPRVAWHGTIHTDQILLDGVRLPPASDMGQGGRRGWGWNSGYAWSGIAWRWFTGLTDEGRASLGRQAGFDIASAAELGQAISLLFVMTLSPLFAAGYTILNKGHVLNPSPVLEFELSRLPILGYFEDPYVMGQPLVLVLPARGYQGGPDAVVALRDATTSAVF